jgi:hypothetical protein
MVLRVKVKVKALLLSFALAYLRAPLRRLSAFIRASLTFLLTLDFRF